MQVSTAQAAARLGISHRAAGYALGDAGVTEPLGTALFVDHLAVQMLERSQVAGRRWSSESALAALELLTRGETSYLRTDARSRLRARLRTMDAATIASRARGILGRIRRVTAPQGTALLEAVAADAATNALSDALAELGLVGDDAGVRFLRWTGGESKADLVRAGVVDDANGEVVLLVGATGGAGEARTLVESYLLGDTRVARAAGDELERRARLL